MTDLPYVTSFSFCFRRFSCKFDKFDRARNNYNNQKGLIYATYTTNKCISNLIKLITRFEPRSARRSCN